MKTLQKKLIILTLASISFINVNSQTWYEVQKIVAGDREGEELFGSSVCVSGDFAIIGAFWDAKDSSGVNEIYDAGSAYIFQRDGSGVWNQVQKISASDRDSGDIFGWYVSMSGDYAMVAAPYENEDATGGNTLKHAGSVYVFEKDGGGNWIQVQKIIASDRDSLDQFGQVVSMSGNYAVVGVCYEDHDSAGGNYMKSSGSAYIFERDVNGAWNEVQKIAASDRAPFDLFGWSVGISGDNIILGALQHDNDTAGIYIQNAGAAYIFERDVSGTWNEVQKLVFSDRQINDWFGQSVDISGKFAVVCAAGEDEDTSGGNFMEKAGAAIFFERDVNGIWNEMQKVVASDRTADDQLGREVSISGNFAVVRSLNGEDLSGGNTMLGAGSAYIFGRDWSGNWYEVQKIVASDRDSLTQFGRAVSIDGGYMFVGANYERKDLSGGNPMWAAGAAYIYECPTVGIYENDFGTSFNAYPNPTNGKLTIDLGQEYQEIDITVMNLLGQVTYTQKFETTDVISVELNGLSGMYIVKINTVERISATLRVLKNY